MRLACLGSSTFLSSLPPERFDVRFLPVEPTRLWDWDAVCATCGEPPDVFIYTDCSLPPPIPDVHRFPCPTVFCCIDSHIHHWYPTYAQAFDLCTVSLRDHLPPFRGRLGARELLWLPPSAPAVPADALPDEACKQWDLLFVGKVDPQLTPQRAAILTALGERMPGLVVTRGDWRVLFPKARLVLNIAEGGDLNYRVFEALSVGSCLLTPAIGHGLTELFTPGADLFTYPADDIDAVQRLADSLLPDTARRAQVARQGLERMRRQHHPRQRAEAFAAWLDAHPLQELTRRRLAAAHDIDRLLRVLFLHWAEALPGDPRALGYLRAAKGA